MLRDPYSDRDGRMAPLVPVTCVWCGTGTHSAPERAPDAACGVCARRRRGIRFLAPAERRALPAGVTLRWLADDPAQEGEGSKRVSPPLARFEILTGASAPSDSAQVPAAARRFAELAIAHGWSVELVYALARDRRGEGTREVASLSVRCARAGRRLVGLWINGSHVSLAGISAARLRAEITK